MKQGKVKLDICLPGYFNFLLVKCVHVEEILDNSHFYAQSKVENMLLKVQGYI